MRRTPVRGVALRGGLAGLVLCVASAGAAVAQGSTTLYKSTGPDGRTVYSDHPPAGARSAKTLTFKSGPTTPLSAQTLAHIAALKASGDARAKAPPPGGIVLFSAAWCGYCQKAKAHLSARNVAYREVDIDTPDGLLAFSRAGGQGGVPLLVADGRSVAGYSPASYDALLAPRQ